jgi:hypothetical protein
MWSATTTSSRSGSQRFSRALPSKTNKRLQRRRNDEREPLYEKLAQWRERALKAAAGQNRRLLAG